MNEEKPEKKEKSKVLKYIKYFGIFVAGILLITLINGFGIYKYNWDNSISSSLSRLIPYPAVIVNNEIIKVQEFRDNYKIIQHFNETQIVQDNEGDFSDKDIQAELLNKLALNKVVTQLAEKYGVTVSQEELDYEIDNIVKNIEGGESLASRLELMYGISEDEFIEKSLVPEILFYKLHDKYLSDPEIDQDSKLINEEKEFQAKETLEKLKAGADFNNLAKELTDDTLTKEYGGDLGFFGRGEMVKEFEDAAFNLDVGQVSEVIQTNYGFHIIKVTDKKVDENGDEQVKASHILFKVEDSYDAWIDKNIANSKVIVLMGGFKWENGQIVAK